MRHGVRLVVLLGGPSLVTAMVAQLATGAETTRLSVRRKEEGQHQNPNRRRERERARERQTDGQRALSDAKDSSTGGTTHDASG